VSDGKGGVNPDTVIITVLTQNLLPIANAGPDQTVNVGSVVTLNASASSDPEGNTLSFVWVEGTTVLGTTVQISITPTTGVHPIMLVVNDNNGGISFDTVVVTVVASLPPTIIVDNKPLVLWPPKHQYVMVKVDDIVKSVKDQKGQKISVKNVRIASVSSDEADEARTNKGKKRNEDIVIGCTARTVFLIAERDEKGNGRVYTINLTVKDAQGVEGSASYEVWVPPSVKKPAVNDGVSYTVYAKAPTFDPKGDDRFLSELNALLNGILKFLYNFPNPFNPSTEISFAIPEDQHVTLKVYDMAGREVATLVDEIRTAGIHSVTFNANRIASGMYFYRLQAGSSVQVNKMILLK
jgi:hypothetical protein